MDCWDRYARWQPPYYRGAQIELECDAAFANLVRGISLAAERAARVSTYKPFRIVQGPDGVFRIEPEKP